ncbi:MAG: hypothetical protein H6Q70_234 [Firmicutes bacterium]|nr:hypothetical protein [Bacillota bacterium]
MADCYPVKLQLMLLYIGGTKKVILSFTGTTSSVQSLSISLSAGSQQVKIQVNDDTTIKKYNI